MRSMTGFGRGVAEHAGARATVDVRAVNHRFLDIKLRGASIAPAVEEQIASRVRATVERGAIGVSIHLVHRTGASRIDREAARAAHAELAELARTLGIAGPDLALVLAQPGVIADDDRDDGDDTAIRSALDAALAQLDAMRVTEGRALARELAARFAELARLHARVAELAAGIPADLARKLRDRIRRLVRDEVDDLASDTAGWLDPARLAQEVAMLADRADVTEELVRLASHLEQARTLLADTAPVGRRFDFLAQEIGRELNTIGSKSASAEVTSLVVEAKAALEKAREQIQNVE